MGRSAAATAIFNVCILIWHDIFDFVQKNTLVCDKVHESTNICLDSGQYEHIMNLGCYQALRGRDASCLQEIE